MIFCFIITLFQNNVLTCSSDLKFSKLGMGEGDRSQCVGVLSGTVELLCWWEKNVKWFQIGTYKKKHT